MKVVGTYGTVRYDESGDDTRVEVTRFRANKRETDRILHDSEARHALHRKLVDDGTLAPSGCDCYHCQQDWDCCGNFFTHGATYRRASRGFTATQTFQRNI